MAFTDLKRVGVVSRVRGIVYRELQAFRVRVGVVLNDSVADGGDMVETMPENKFVGV